MTKEIILYKTAYGERERVYSECGNPIQPTYGYEINSKGQKILVKNGEKNIYEEIQAQAEDTKIENILARVAIGDMSDFRPDGIYQDISEVPNNLIQAKREMQKLENMWQKVPNEMKAKYDWSVEKFISEAGKESWLIDMGLIQPKTTIEEPKKLEKEVKTEE